MSEQVPARIARLLEQESEPDDALRAVVRALVTEPEIDWAGIAFLEEGALALGPQAGAPDEDRRVRVPVAFQGEPVGELWVDGRADASALERVAALVAGHVLIGWDTRGEAWEP